MLLIHRYLRFTNFPGFVFFYGHFWSRGLASCKQVLRMLEIISGHPFLLNICVQNVPIAPRNVYNYHKYFLFALTKQLTSKIMFYAGDSDISKQQGQGQSEFVIVLSV